MPLRIDKSEGWERGWEKGGDGIQRGSGRAHLTQEAGPQSTDKGRQKMRTYTGSTGSSQLTG